jgi:hypothetical protein
MFFVPCVLIFTLTASTVFAYTPVRVFGQADMQSFAANRGGAASAETLNYPLGSDLDADGGYYVADRNNHRVLYFANDGDRVADRVYGQHGDFSAHISNNDGAGNSGAASADNLSMPTAVSLDSTGGIYVTDRDNHRVLYFANDGNTTADRVYGQYGNFGTNMVNNNGSVVYGEPGPDNFSTYILGVAVDSQDGIYVSDTANHRILYFANDGNTTADRVYGQWDNMNWGVRNNDGAGNIGAPSANSLNFPRGVTVDASDGLYIADRDNNRILYFANDGDTTADRVFGQHGNFASNVESNDGGGNVGAPTPDNLSHPKDMSVGPNGGLYVADSFHNRVLYFASDGDTTADGNSADFGAELHEPGGIVVLPNGEFYVSDTLNNRILHIQCPEWGG